VQIVYKKYIMRGCFCLPSQLQIWV